MTTLFLGCFAFGLFFTVASFLLGALDGTHIHIPGLPLFGGPHHGSGTHGSSSAHSGVHVSPFNLSTASAFLTWFGGAGYLLTRYSGFTTFLITTVATLLGL